MANSQKNNLIKGRSLFSLSFILGIVILNLILIFPLFTSAYTNFLGSFEAVYIAEARFIFNNFTHLSYNSLWHLGFPFYLFYNPLLPFLISGFHFITHLDFSYLYRIIVGLAYIASPLTLYLFVKYLTRKELPAVIAALAFSTSTNFFAFLSPGILDDLKIHGFVPWKLIGLAIYGQGPHIIALALIPLAALFFLHTLKYPSLKYYVLTGIMTALVALTHWPSFMILILMQIVLLFSEILLGHTFRKFKTAFFCFLLTYGFAAFWLNPAFLARSYSLGGEEVLANWVKLIPISFVVVPITITILFLIFDRRPRLQPFQVAFFWFVIPLVFIIAYNNYDKALVPKPDFLTPELTMASAVLLAVFVTILLVVLLRILRFRLKERVYNIINLSSFVFVIGIFIYLVSLSFNPAQNLTKGNSNIKDTGVYKVAEHIEKEGIKGRVLAEGDASLWLNVFSNSTQVSGFSELGDSHNFEDIGAKEVLKGEDKEVVSAWLSAFNATYLVVGKNRTQRFEEFLEKDIEIDDWIIFKIPLKNDSIVKLVDTEKIDQFSYDANNSHESIKSYQSIIEEDPAFFTSDWPKDNQLKIEANLEDNQGLIIQTTYDKGFNATIDGKFLKVGKDQLDFVYLKPGKSGKVEINLFHKLPVSVYIGYVLTLLTILVLLLLQIKPVRKLLMWQEEKAPPGVLLHAENLAKNGEVNPELIEDTKKYYREKEDIDWVEMTDQFKGIVSYFHKNRENLVKKMIEQYGQGTKYLDIGCGTGLLLRHLPKGSVGMDINPRAIAKAQKNAPHTALVVADIDNIPFPGNSVDTALCVDVLDRLPYPDQAISEMERILKKDGVLIGTIPAVNPMWRLQFMTSTAPATEPYHKEYTKEEVKKLLARFETVHLSPALSNMTWAFVVKKK